MPIRSPVGSSSDFVLPALLQRKPDILLLDEPVRRLTPLRLKKSKSCDGNEKKLHHRHRNPLNGSSATHRRLRGLPLLGRTLSKSRNQRSFSMRPGTERNPGLHLRSYWLIL